MTSKAQARASAKYDASHTKQIKMKLNYETDKDIIEKLEKVGNKQGYIKELIRKDLESRKDYKRKDKVVNMRKVRDYNATKNKYGIFNVNNNSVDGLFPTVEAAQDEIDDLVKFCGFKDGDFEIVKIENK